jgi:hypothetical protein
LNRHTKREDGTRRRHVAVFRGKGKLGMLGILKKLK